MRALMWVLIIVVLAGAAGLFFWLRSAPAAQIQPSTAHAVLVGPDGVVAGQAWLSQTPGGVVISLNVTGLTPGMHGAHIHDAGRCEPPAFSSAGGHFNPEGKKHGAKNPDGPHAGDLGNLEVGADGLGSISLVTKEVTLLQGLSSLLKQGGNSLIIHEKADDEATDPSGNSGARIACGVITLS